jgi:hypothetical protein
MARTIKLKVTGTDIRHEYTCHASPHAAHGGAQRGATIIAFLDPRDHEVYYDWIPAGQPLPEGAVIVRDSMRDGRNRWDTSEAVQLLLFGEVRE